MKSLRLFLCFGLLLVSQCLALADPPTHRTIPLRGNYHPSATRVVSDSTAIVDVAAPISLTVMAYVLDSTYDSRILVYSLYATAPVSGLTYRPLAPVRPYWLRVAYREKLLDNRITLGSYPVMRRPGWGVRIL